MTSSTPPPIPPQPPGSPPTKKPQRILWYVLSGCAGIILLAIVGTAVAVMMFDVIFGGGSSQAAIKVAERDWSENWIQVGDTWVTKSASHPLLLQIKNRTTSVTELRVSESDKLNGIEWTGIVNFDASAERLYAPTDFSAMVIKFHKGWTDWFEPGSVYVLGQKMGQKEPVVAYSVQKQSGKWQILSKTAPIPVGLLRETSQKPLETEVPK